MKDRAVAPLVVNNAIKLQRLHVIGCNFMAYSLFIRSTYPGNISNLSNRGYIARQCKIYRICTGMGSAGVTIITDLSGGTSGKIIRT